MTRRQRIFTAVLVGGGLLFGACLAEIVLRIYGSVASTGLASALVVDPYDVKVEPHGTVGFRPKPGATFDYANGTTANINEMGYRGPAVEVDKPPDVFRVVLLGGSTTFGWGVDDDETIAAHMRRLLAERYPDRRVEVVNLAFDGYDSYQLLERLRSDGLALEPDAVIVNSGVNDVRNAPFANLTEGDDRTLLYRETLRQLRHEREHGGPTLWTRLKHYLYLARLPGWIRQQVSMASVDGEGPGVGQTPVRWDALDYFEGNLVGMLRLVDGAEGPALIFSTPPSSLRTRYEDDEPVQRSYWIRDAGTTQMYRDSLSQRMRVLAERESARGGKAVFVPHEELPPSVFLDDAHLTPEGNRIVAQAFVDALEPLLSAGAPSPSGRGSRDGR